ncbi:DNA alkylation repair protein [Poseidonocella sedimentorum]|uniref:3-methyladenine DNA glycosylase AlkC n=1 Tax=Poseidonocella sedimentorum TaxID=871652 RepID=A0A1I6CNV4_9RHOB|nr:DNA alkylation repair protein [Poseidonocella sedimentorum]SFQ94852.1 3-methyladenine DNA glycosylase AlkC [Poseidonocella sedimentorum]
MARGPEGGGPQGFSLKDQLFNAATLGDLAAEYAALPGFDPARFLAEVLPGLEGRGLLERLDWIADCIEARLPADFPAMCEALEAAMPPPLDPARQDNDFGRFIHAVPGILAVRHGLDGHRDRALALLRRATKRFSMEFYIRPFLNHYPEHVLATLRDWARDENYHVRRLVSEGTRPKLPWARGLTIDPQSAVPLLDILHADQTRYVTRSVANHLNDLSKIAPDLVLERLGDWAEGGQQAPDEMRWMTRHALRTAVRRGEPGALRLLGFDPEIPVAAVLSLPAQARIGESLAVEVTLTAARDLPVVVDYRIAFHRPSGASGEKVFKLKSARLTANAPLTLRKVHKLKADATTFTLHPGPHRVVVQVNGVDRGEGRVDLIDVE